MSIKYVQIYRDSEIHVTLENRDNLAQTIQQVLDDYPGAWITVIETDIPTIRTTLGLPVPIPTVEELELTPQGRELLNSLLAQDGQSLDNVEGLAFRDPRFVEVLPPNQE